MPNLKQDSGKTSVAFIIARCIAAALAFYAVGKHSYNVYIVTRWAVFLACGWETYLSARGQRPLFGIVNLAAAVVFNPFLPFHLARQTWHLLDVAAGLVILVAIALDVSGLALRKK